VKITTGEYEGPIDISGIVLELMFENFKPLYHLFYTDGLNEFVESKNHITILPDGESSTAPTQELYEKISVVASTSFLAEQGLLFFLNEYFKEKNQTRDSNIELYWRQRPHLYFEKISGKWIGYCRLLLSDKKLEEDKRGQNTR